MSRPSVLLIGRSGVLGGPILDELERQKASLLQLADMKMVYSIKTLLASGFRVADGVGELDDEQFDVNPELPREISR